jgi:hypothetical protein
LQSTLLVGEAAEDSLASRDLDEMKDGQREQDQDGVGEPRIERSQMETLWNVVRVQKLEDVKVE